MDGSLRHDPVPDEAECVLRERAILEEECDETGRPLPGPCVCVDGMCRVDG
jgi:hypothetical protein